jgi:hypothetical protein
MTCWSLADRSLKPPGWLPLLIHGVIAAASGNGDRVEFSGRCGAMNLAFKINRSGICINCGAKLEEVAPHRPG